MVAYSYLYPCSFLYIEIFGGVYLASSTPITTLKIIRAHVRAPYNFHEASANCETEFIYDILYDKSCNSNGDKGG